MNLSSSLFAPLAAFALLSLAPARAGSIELVSPDALDIARELGFNIAKFQAKFEEPVFATLAVTVFPVGAKEGVKHEQTTSHSMKTHNFSLTLKDHNAMASALGMTPNPKLQGTVEYTVFHPLAQLSLREKAPFGELKTGQSLASFVERQSMEALELDKPIPLVVKGGPFDDKNPAPKSIRDNYYNAPGFYLFEVTFSKTKPAAEKPAAEKSAAEKPESPKK